MGNPMMTPPAVASETNTHPRRSQPRYGAAPEIECQRCEGRVPIKQVPTKEPQRGAGVQLAGRSRREFARGTPVCRSRLSGDCPVEYNSVMPPLMYRDMANVARLAAQEDECEAKGATSSRAGRPSRRSPPEYPARAAAAGWVCRLARPPAGCIENFFSVQLPLDRLAASSTLPFGLFCE
jgi:hypothetical protein